MCKIQNAKGKAFLNLSKLALQSNFVTQAFCAFDYNNLILSKGEKMAINLNEANFTEHTAKGAVLVDFWAAWCGPCQAVLPIMDELSKDFEGRASICKVNVDEERALARQYGVSSIPTILLMKDGQVVERIVGAQSKSVFETKLNALL